MSHVNTYALELTCRRAKLVCKMLSVDDLKEVVTGALSTVLSRVNSDQGSSAQGSSQARASTPRPVQVRAQQPHIELEDDEFEVPPLPPPLPVVKETSHVPCVLLECFEYINSSLLYTKWPIGRHEMNIICISMDFVYSKVNHY